MFRQVQKKTNDSVCIVSELLQIHGAANVNVSYFKKISLKQIYSLFIFMKSFSVVFFFVFQYYLFVEYSYCLLLWFLKK